MTRKVGETQKEYQRRYFQENKEKIYAKRKQRSRKENDRKYYENNRNRIIKRSIDYNRDKYHNDPEFKVKELYRDACRRQVKISADGNKEGHWVDSLGCTYAELKEHIESQFLDGMTWENHGFYGWHIDHIIPLTRGGTNHFTNLQPLWAKDNLSKGNKIV